MSDKLIASLREALEIQSKEYVATIQGLSTQIERLTSYSNFAGSTGKYGSRATKESYRLQDDANVPNMTFSGEEEQAVDRTPISAPFFDKDNQDTEHKNVEYEHSMLMARIDARSVNASHDGKLHISSSGRESPSCHDHLPHDQKMSGHAESLPLSLSPLMSQTSWEATLPSQDFATEQPLKENVATGTLCVNASVTDSAVEKHSAAFHEDSTRLEGSLTPYTRYDFSCELMTYL